MSDEILIVSGSKMGNGRDRDESKRARELDRRALVLAESMAYSVGNWFKAPKKTVARVTKWVLSLSSGHLVTL